MERGDHYPAAQQGFIDKWSQDVFNLAAFTMIPNLLLVIAPELGITPQELVILINIESHRWATRLPHPSVQRLAERTGYSTRQVTRLITQLENKGILWREKRGLGKTNEYDISPLIFKLDEVAKLVADNIDRETGQICLANNDNIGSADRTGGSLKEDKYKEDLLKKISNQILRTKAAQESFLYRSKPYTGSLDDISF